MPSERAEPGVPREARAPLERSTSAGGQVVRIGCGAGFWGDSALGPQQLVASGEIDYLVLDYLAEITMSLLSRARSKDPAAGYATDFPEVIAALAPEIERRRIRVVTNAGGVNPRACQAALRRRLEALGVDLAIGIVTGDDLLDRASAFRERGVRDMFSGAPFPARPWSVNAYLGAYPIAGALDAGADVVITGRCVDSALALGPLVHEFRWPADALTELAGGSLAGHVIECGTQATGGIVTDWEAVADGWDRMGFPIAVCSRDGSFVLTKPAGTGGRVAPETVAEQIVYEIGDPGAYLLPDVTCDFRQVSLRQVGPDRVEVRGAAGRPPTGTYKVSATYQDGFRSGGTLMICGSDAARKAERVADAILRRTRRIFAERGLADYRRTDVEVLGTEAYYGAHGRGRASREVLLKIAVHHDDRAALEIFSREVAPAATSMAQGITGFGGGRPAIAPLVRLFSVLVEKEAVQVAVEVDGRSVEPARRGEAVAPRGGGGSPPAEADRRAAASAAPDVGEDAVEVPLVAIAYGRSGDKGDDANIGVLARRAEFVPLLRAVLTPEAVKRWLAHLVDGEVERFEIPGLLGFNFLLHRALGGGGVASLRYDPQGKVMAQLLMDLPVRVPRAWVRQGWVTAVAGGPSSR